MGHKLTNKITAPVGGKHHPQQLQPHQKYLILEYRASWIFEHRIQSGCMSPLGLRHMHGLESEPTIAESVYNFKKKKKRFLMFFLKNSLLLKQNTAKAVIL